MVRVIFDGTNLNIDKIYQQTGGGGLSYFEGVPYQRGFGYSIQANQRGAGLGSALRSIWRMLKPLASTITPIAKEIGKEGLATTARVLNKVIESFCRRLFRILKLFYRWLKEVI